MTRPALKPCLRCGGALALHDNDWADPVLWSWQCASCGLFSKEFATQAEAVGDANSRPLDEANVRRIYAIRYVHHLVVKHMRGPAIEALDALDDDGELHRAVHSALVGECSDEWFAEQQRVDSATIPGGPT